MTDYEAKRREKFYGSMIWIVDGLSVVKQGYGNGDVGVFVGGKDWWMSDRQVPYGMSMPTTNRMNEIISMEDVPFEEQVYLSDNLNSNGKPRRVYALPSIVGLLDQKNPVTRKRFTASNIKRVRSA